MGHKRAPLADRLWAKVDIRGSDECWLWNGGLTLGGYGAIRRGDGTRAQIGAHVAAFEVTNGPVPEGHEVLHTCDIRRCCNPAHLFDGTQAANIADMHEKGRAKVGQDHGMAVLTNDQVLAIWAGAGIQRSSDLASEYGVSLQTIGKIARRERWAHLTDGLPDPAWPPSRKGILHRKAA